MPLSFLISAIVLLAVAAYTDVTRRIIPNWIPASLAVLFLASAAVRPITPDFFYAFLIAIGVFVVLALGFAFRILGGGDVKLMSAMALWVGLPGILEFVMLTALIGGGVALAMLAYRRVAVVLPAALAPASSDSATSGPSPVAGPAEGAEPKITLPYGVAISLAGALVLIAHHASL